MAEAEDGAGATVVGGAAAATVAKAAAGDAVAVVTTGMAAGEVEGAAAEAATGEDGVEGVAEAAGPLPVCKK